MFIQEIELNTEHEIVVCEGNQKVVQELIEDYLL